MLFQRNEVTMKNILSFIKRIFKKKYEYVDMKAFKKMTENKIKELKSHSV